MELTPNEKDVEVNEFETSDFILTDEITITITLTDVYGGANIITIHEGLPLGISVTDN